MASGKEKRQRVRRGASLGMGSWESGKALYASVFTEQGSVSERRFRVHLAYVDYSHAGF